MVEQWIRWEPVKGLSDKYYIESIVDNMAGFEILMSDSKEQSNKIRVIFEHSVDAYRSTYGSFRQEKIYFIETHYGTKFYAEWTFFKVTHSSYLLWLSEQSYGITDSLSPIHFSFLAMDSVVDVVATYEPKIEIFIEE